MKRRRFIFVSLLIAGIGAVTCDIAAARYDHHGHYQGRTHTHVGVYFGPAFGLGWHYQAPYTYAPYSYRPYGYAPYAYSPYYYPPYSPVVVVPSAPPAYIEQAPPEQGQGQGAQPAPNDWYYCRKPEGYYPYVRRCPDGWQRVPAQPQE